MEEYNITEGGAEESPVYSQITMEYVDSQTNKARKKGMVQGILLAFGIVILATGIYAAVSAVLMIANGSFYSKIFGSSASSVLDKKSIDKLDNLYSLIESTYLEDTDKKELQEGIYKGMLEALDDPYSVYYNKEEFEEMMEGTSGTFEGIGAYLTQDPETKVITVVRPIKDSPAEAAGMLADDIVVEVDGEDITGQDINLVVSKLRGPKGTEVSVGVMREGTDDVITFKLKRDEINAVTVDSKMLDDDIGYIQISEFADATADQFREAFDNLEEQGMKSLIIDLRSNGGGYVDISVEIADRLVKDGVIVSVEDKHGLSYKYEDKGDENYLKVPCVLLVDGNTASASEILTGALRDHGLVTVIGTQTFGKGITQIITPLDDGSGVKITNSKYFPPDGEDIHGIGIKPDIVVEWDDEKYKADGTDNQLEAAKDFLKNKQGEAK
ncbi:MAG: S41 family peptidase [Lachnospiraceae bacterium]|nr:S41 family peptidase [Lachnospiraceae bacterium]